MTKSARGIGMTSSRTQQRLIQRLQDEGITHREVLNAMAIIPRHQFLDEALAHRAYDDSALPIGFGQTISQPYIVALMTQTLLNHHPEPCQKVLEIGTGSGYQAAILSKLVASVYGIERVEPLYQIALKRLAHLGYKNIYLKYADGYTGWPEEAPFDGILVTAGAPEIPVKLKEQLSPEGGVMVIPMGPPHDQYLFLIQRKEDAFSQRRICAVRFVPFLPGVE